MTSNDAPKPDLSVSVASTLSDAPEKVWRALTDPELVAAWLAPNDLNAQSGARFTLKRGAPDESDVHCEVMRADPHRLLQYRWRSSVDGRDVDSVVTFTLTETKSGGTLLNIVHDDFAAATAGFERMEMSPRALGADLRRRARPARQITPRRARTGILMAA